jgi:integrase
MAFKCYGPAMPNKKKFDLKSPNSRRSIPIGIKEHTAYLRDGLYLTYRKTKARAAWFARKRREGVNQYISYPLGVADDTLPANNADVLSFDQAKSKAEKWFEQETGLVQTNKSDTVRNLFDDYLADQEMKKRRSHAKPKRRIETHILPVLGDIPLRKLTHNQVEKWLHNLAKSLPRTRGRQNAVTYREVTNVDDEEYRRKRQASANTTWNLLKAALNFGYKTGRVSNRGSWDKVQSFKAVNEPKIVEITFDQLTAVIDACEPEFQHLAKAGLYTGARVSELHRMRVKDFNPKTSKVFLPKTKNSSSRYVFLNDEALELFVTLTKGRSPDEVIFLKDGEPWNEGSQQYPMYNACDVACVTRKFTIHQFRHQCACICLENGMTMAEVSYMLGHKSIAITERYYARFSPDYIQDKVQRYAPRLRPAAPQNDPNDSNKVIPIQSLKKRA